MKKGILTGYIGTIEEDSKGLYITLPKLLCKHMKWKVGDLLEWKIVNKQIYLSKVKQ